MLLVIKFGLMLIVMYFGHCFREWHQIEHATLVVYITVQFRRNLFVFRTSQNKEAHRL